MIKFKIKTDVHGRCDLDCEFYHDDFNGCQLKMETEILQSQEYYYVPGKECPLHKMSNACGVYSINFRLEEGD